MKVDYCSDLHLNFEYTTLPGGDLLIIAGDLCETGHFLNNTGSNDEELSASYRKFFKEEITKYNKVLYVMGNHEHHFGVFDDTKFLLLDELPKNVTILDNEFVKIGDVWFYGMTLWTNMNKKCPITMNITNNNVRDFRTVRFYDGTLFKAEDSVQEFDQAIEILNLFLKDKKDEKVVVISHHAPSPLSINYKYINDHHMNGAFCSDLTTFIQDHTEIKYWIHGHMHDRVDYMINSTNVISNPRGYKGHEMSAEYFDASRNFEV